MSFLDFNIYLQMKFQFFSFSLNQNGLFINTEKDKNEILKDILKREIVYSHHTQKIYLFSEETDNCVVWAIWRKASINKWIINNWEKKTFEKVKEDNYPSCKIIFNLSQNISLWWHRIAFEYNMSIFQNSLSTIQSFENQLNKLLQKEGYAISIYPMVDKVIFRDIIKNNQVEKLTFVYSMPNFLNLQNSLNDELKGVGSKYWSTNAKIELENKNGELILEQWDPLLDQSAEYCSQWAWSFELKVKWVKAKYSSDNSIKTIEIDEINFTWPQVLFSKLYEQWVQ